MSDLELERSAVAPHRWVELCNAFRKKHPDEIGSLPVRAARNINLKALTANPKDNDNLSPNLFLVPGGRYILTSSLEAISVWDLGCNSLENAESAGCKLIASAEQKDGCRSRTFIVQATPDGLGLEIFLTDV